MSVVKEIDNSSLRNYNNDPVGQQQYCKLPYSKRNLDNGRSVIVQNEGLLIVQDDNNVHLSISKKFLEKYSAKDLASYITIATSKIFTNKDRSLVSDYIPKNMGCAMFMKNVEHYSGGRYCALLWAHIIASYMRITVFTNMKPNFLKDFKYMPFSENIEWDITEKFGAHFKENKFQFVIGVPNIEGQYAQIYADKWKIPCYMLIFESPNYIREHRSGADSTDEYWAGYKQSLHKATKVIAISNLSASKTKEWLQQDNNKRVPPIDVIYPNLNQHVADRVLQLDNVIEMNEICYISRMTHYKNPILIIREICGLESPPDVINLIGRAGSGTTGELKKLTEKFKNKTEIKLYEGISDIEKFMILKRSKLLVTPSIFEGFGCSPMEAFYLSKPVIAYNIPVFKEVYGNTIVYVECGDETAMAKEVSKLLNDPKRREELGKAGRKRVLEWCTYDFTRERMAQVLPIETKLSISIGLIVLNGAEFLQKWLEWYYPIAKEIIICEGAVEKYAEVNPYLVKDGHSIDDTIKIIKDFNDKDGKIKFISRDNNGCWKDKMEMQNIIAERVMGDIFFKVDFDEFYHYKGIERIRDEFTKDKNLTIFKFGFYHFWHSLRHYCVGGQWESRMFRVIRWNPNFRFKQSFNYLVNTIDGKIVDRPHFKVLETEEKLCFHLGYALKNDDLVRAKINYYKNRGIEKTVNDTWTNWKVGNNMPTSPTHGSGTVEEFKGQYPEVLNYFLQKGY